jgi:2',3'-cyclic-nucleotide 2'-phosphodiesterase (5'-nucleotidase family)
MGVYETAPAAGPLIDLAHELQGFDVVLGNGGASDYSATINGAKVVAGKSRGQSYGRTTIKYDTVAGRITATKAAFVQPLVARVTQDAGVAAILDVYRSQLAVRLSRTIAASTAVFTAADACGNALGRTCESATGSVVADALRATYDADVAILNSGSIRAGLTCPAVDSAADFCPAFSGLPAPITEGQVQAVLPFGNFAATATVSGAELKAMLENGVSLVLDAAGRFPQASGICFWYDISRPAGSRVLAVVKQGADDSCSGAAVDFGANANYDLVTNDFIAAGGDGYTASQDAPVIRERLDTVVSRYLSQQKTIAPPSPGRINCTAGCPTLLNGAPLRLPSGAPPSAGGTATVRPPSTGNGGLR